MTIDAEEASSGMPAAFSANPTSDPCPLVATEPAVDCRTPPHVLQQFATRARRLYSLPAVAVRVVELAKQPEMDTVALRECIEADPALTGKILRVANSSLFGLSQQVVNLSQAFALLGSKTVRILVLGFSLPEELLCNVEAHVLSRYWRQAALKAVSAREISQRIWRLPGDEAFLAGLFQDIGMLALIQDLGIPYVRFVERIFSEGGQLAALERQTLGFDHTQLSAALVLQWGLPITIAHAVARPPEAGTAEERTPHERALAEIVHLAERLAEFVLQGRAALLSEIIELVERSHREALPQLETLMDALEAHVPPLLDLLAAQPVEPVDYRGLLLQAYQLLSDATDQSADADEAHRRLCRELESQTRELSAAVRHFAGRTADACSPAAACGRDAAAANRLPSRAGVNHNGSALLLEAVAAAITRCRQARRPLSLLLAELDPEVRHQLGPAGREAQSDQRMRMLSRALQAALGNEGAMLEVSPHRLAILLEGYDRPQGVELARQLLRAVRHWSLERQDAPLALGIGLATVLLPSRNFPPRDLVEAAERCLQAVQRSGGEGVKSLDIY